MFVELPIAMGNDISDTTEHRSIIVNTDHIRWVDEIHDCSGITYQQVSVSGNYLFSVLMTRNDLRKKLKGGK